MQKYYDYQPTGFDPKGAFIYDDRLAWFVAPCGRNRDSDTLVESNFVTLVKLLKATGPEGDDDELGEWTVLRLGHWANGWFEIILVKPGTEAYRVAEEAESALADYPVLNDEDYSERQWMGATEYWERSSIRSRIEACAESHVSIFAARRDEMPSDCFDYCNPDRC